MYLYVTDVGANNGSDSGVYSERRRRGMMLLLDLLQFLSVKKPSVL